MKRISMLSLSTVLALGIASISNSAIAQQKVTRDQLVGTWTLISCMNANGRCRVDFNGRMMMDAMGNYIYAASPRNRPKCTVRPCGGGQLNAEQYRATTLGFVSNFGHWSLNDADQTMTLDREGALFSNNEGREVKEKVSLTGDELQLVFDNATEIWRRAR